MTTANTRMRNNLLLTLTAASIFYLILVQAAPPQAGSTSSTANISKVASNQEKAKESKRFFVEESAITNGEKKFQSRMMKAEAQAPMASLQDSYYSDSWNPHSLVPTFTDQEQGDEMVALASESEPHQVIVNKTLSELTAEGAIPYQQHNHASEHSRESRQQTSKLNQERVVGKQPRPLVDEYYGDDEDDDEELNLGSKSAPSEHFDHDQFRKQQLDRKPFQPQQVASQQQYHEEQLFDDAERSSQADSLTGKSHLQSSSRAIKQVSHTDAASWLPTSTNPSSAEQKQPSATVTQLFSDKQIGGIRPLSTGGGSEKLAALIAGQREPFSKTEAAIEYLRNMLKSKQQSQSQLNTTEHRVLPSSVKQSIEQSVDKQANLLRLSSFATRLSQMLNNTVSQNPESSKTKVTENNNVDNSPSSKLMSENVGQTDGKFSIVDAKTPTTSSNHDSSKVYQTSQSSYASSTTRLPSVESLYSNSHPSVSQADIGLSSALYAHDSTLLLGTTPNGTPVGGDYIESLDDFPRDVRSQQQHPLHSPDQSFFASESHLIPVRQQDSKQDEQTLVASSSEQHHEIAPKRHPSLSNLGEPLRYHHDSYEANRGPTHSVANSLRYFRMAQPATVGGSQEYGNHLQGLKTHNEAQKDQALVEKDIFGSVNQPAELPSPTFTQKLPEVPKPTKQQIDAETKKDRPDTSEQKRIVIPQAQVKQTAPIQRQPLEQQQQPQQQHYQQRPQPQISTSKIYNHKQQLPSQAAIGQNRLISPQQTSDNIHIKHKPAYNQTPNLHGPQKPPKIVSYNYFESPSDPSESEIFATNYQLGDALYSSAGGLEHVLSGPELEAIQHQFVNVDHPIVPIQTTLEQQHNYQSHQPKKETYPNQQELANLAGFVNNDLRSQNHQPDSVQTINSNIKQTEDNFKELASNIDQVSVSSTQTLGSQQQILDLTSPEIQSLNKQQKETRHIISADKPTDNDKKKKNLIVYLNHPRPNDMSKGSESYNFNQSTGDQQFDSFISAKEFDAHGISKDTKHLDISSLSDLENTKEGQDKDGLSVVVIGDAYKYKKIVLLISSKSGGLKFIPMVKEMKK